MMNCSTDYVFSKHAHPAISLTQRLCKREVSNALVKSNILVPDKLYLVIDIYNSNLVENRFLPK